MGLKSSLTPIIAGWAWISGCEYGINQVWLKSQWEEYYSTLGMSYPGDMMKWAVWCLVFALAMRMLVSRFNVLAAGIVSWVLVVGLSLLVIASAVLVVTVTVYWPTEPYWPALALTIV